MAKLYNAMPGLTKNINRCATLTAAGERVGQRSVAGVSLSRYAIYVIVSSLANQIKQPPPFVYYYY